MNSTPWAQVFVDGALAGETPLLKHSLASGRHRIRLVNPALSQSLETTVDLAPGEHRVIPVDLAAGKLAKP